MQNKLTDLNNHLFAQLERLGNEELTNEELTAEIDRARAITSVSSQIIANASLTLRAAEFKADYGRNEVHLPPLLTE